MRAERNPTRAVTARDDVLPPPLPLVRFTCKLRAADAVRGVAALGDRFHSRLGNHLRRLVCSSRDAECADCLALEPCPYAALFHGRVHPGAHPLLRGQRLPAPWVFALPHGQRELKRDQLVDLEMVGVGRAWRMLPYLLLALERMPDGKRRRGRPFWPLVPQRLLQRMPGTRARVVWRAGARTLGKVQPPQVWTGNDHSAFQGRLAVEFVSPLALKRDGEVLRHAPRLGELVRAAARRILALAAGWSDVAVPADLRGLFTRADRARVAAADTRPAKWLRDSRRQGRGVPMQGVVGTVRYTGVDAAVLPWLELGAVLHLGKGTAFGLGRIVCQEWG